MTTYGFSIIGVFVMAQLEREPEHHHTQENIPIQASRANTNPFRIRIIKHEETPIMFYELNAPDTQDTPPFIEPIPFMYESTSHSEKFLGETIGPDGEVVEIWKHTMWFRTRSDTSEAFMVLLKASLPDQPIGLFRQACSPADLSNLRQRVESIPWHMLEEPTDSWGHPAHLSVRYTRGNYRVERYFTSRNFDFMAAISPALEWEEQQFSKMMVPLAGLQVSIEVDRAPSPNGVFDVTVILWNPGSHPVVLTDPRCPAKEKDAIPRLGLDIALETTHPVPDFVEIPLEKMQSGCDRETLVLGGGERFKLKSQWKPKVPGRYWISAGWEDYGGPPAGVKHAAIMPLTADPSKPSIPMSEPYAVRGHTHSWITVAVQP